MLIILDENKALFKTVNVQNYLTIVLCQFYRYFHDIRWGEKKHKRRKDSLLKSERASSTSIL